MNKLPEVFMGPYWSPGSSFPGDSLPTPSAGLAELKGKLRMTGWTTLNKNVSSLFREELLKRVTLKHWPSHNSIRVTQVIWQALRHEPGFLVHLLHEVVLQLLEDLGLPTPAYKVSHYKVLLPLLQDVLNSSCRNTEGLDKYRLDKFPGKCWNCLLSNIEPYVLSFKKIMPITMNR